jgi:hypothetical protein
MGNLSKTRGERYSGQMKSQKGRANKEWVEKQGLKNFSKPSNWFEAQLPVY